MTKTKSRDDVVSAGLKKMPDMNGRKKRWIMSSLNPDDFSRPMIVSSGAERMS